MATGRMKWIGVVGLSLILAACLGVARLSGAPTADQTEKLRAVESALQKGESFYKSGKIGAAATALKAAQGSFAEMSGAKELARQLQPLARRLVNLHDNLAVEGANVAALPAAISSLTDTSLGKSAATPSPANPTNPTKPPATRPTRTPANRNQSAAGGISFTRQVAPMLVGKCGNCHVTAAKGQFSMATFTSLMRGSKSGAVVLPGKGNGSRIVEVIESGDMPRGGGSVAKEELAMLSKWIDQGAKFDGANQGDSLAALAPPGAAKMTPEPALSVVAATGKESVLFSRDIAPVIAENCVGCHGTQNNPGGQLRLESFTALLKGGTSGLCVQPGKPAASLVVRKIKGLSGDRMPLRKPALSDAVIAKFEKWIAEGAKFDGYDPGQTMDMVAATYIAGVQTHEQLAAARAERSRKIWRLAIPDDKANEKETKNFLVMGNVGPEMLDQVAAAAEKDAAAIARLYHVPDDKPLVKGKMTIFVCNQRFDYSEFGKMVEDREIPAADRGHSRYNLVNAYGAIVPPLNGEYSLLALVGQQVGGMYIASLGRPPQWFAEGAGAVIGTQMDNKDPRLKAWHEAIPRVLSSGLKPEGFITRSLPEEANEILSMGFVKTMMSTSGRFNSLLKSLREGEDFENAFRRLYGATPSQAAMYWAAKH